MVGRGITLEEYLNAKQRVQHVEIIKCVDCVFSVEIEDDYRMICHNRNGLDSMVFRDDFCSYAERRTDGTSNSSLQR